MAIAESRMEKGVIWVGTNDGLVQVTRDGGKNWTNVMKNIRGCRSGAPSTTSSVAFNAAPAYVVFDFHQVNNRDPSPTRRLITARRGNRS